MGPRALGLLLLLVSGAAGSVLVVENRKSDERPARAASFQRLVGGLGFGPTLQWSACTADLDPRLESSCALDYGPIAGGGCFGSRRLDSVFYYPPLLRGSPLSQPEQSDALSP